MNEVHVEAKHTDALSLRKQRHTERMQWAMLAFMGAIVGGFLSPLIIWLVRLALGG